MVYVGLDTSVARTSVCIMDAEGQVVREKSVASTPEAIAAVIRASGVEVDRIGLAGIKSAWIARGLLDAKLPVIVIDATHAAAALKTGFRNKTDKNDARGIADLMRVNKFRAVSVKSVAAQRDRALLTVREQLRQQSLDARNVIWSILQVEGLKPPKLTNPAFQALVAQSLDDEALAPMLRPLLAVVEHIDGQVAGLDKEIARRAKASSACKRLMTVPGVGPFVALTYAAGVDDSARFRDSRTVGAHFGLTPRRFQSGEVDWSGGISRAGDAGVRRAVSGSQRADPPQPRLVRPEVVGRARGQAPWSGQGQGGTGAQVGRGAAQDVVGGRGLPVEGRSLAAQRDRLHTRSGRRGPSGDGVEVSALKLFGGRIAFCGILHRA